MIASENYLIVSSVLFIIGVIGVITRRNAIIVFMSIEIMLNAVNLVFVTFSSHFGDVGGQIFVFFVIAVAAAEAAIGLAIIIALYRKRMTINLDDVNLLKW